MIFLRSLLFNISFFVTTGLLAILSIPLLVMPRKYTLLMMRFYAQIVRMQMQYIIDLKVQISGVGNIPSGPVIIASKHQSAFDTIFWLGQLPATCYVLKKELLSIPIWGWHARRAQMIGVDRKAGAQALRHLVKHSLLRAREGRQLVIYPEGTRVPPGQKMPYQPGVAAMAASTHLPVIPVATNSGLFWGRRSFVKQPGTLTVSVLPALPQGLGRLELLNQLERAIEAETTRLVVEARSQFSALPNHDA